jgi:hypothetical protein
LLKLTPPGGRPAKQAAVEAVFLYFSLKDRRIALATPPARGALDFNSDD